MVDDSVKKRVLFLCTENSCRSQMAEAITRHYWGERIDAYSAGVRPKGVNPMAKKALHEMGIDGLDALYSKALDEFLGEKIDFVITLCDGAKEECPFFPGATERLHMPFRDPSKEGPQGKVELEDFIEVAREIKGALEALFREKGWI